MKKHIFVALGLCTGLPAAAQIAPLPTNPLVRTPTLTIPAVTFEAVPSGVITLPIATGTGSQAVPEFPLAVKTKGGGGRVTISVLVDGALQSRFSLIDPPQAQTFINTQLANTTTTTISQVNLLAPSVSKLLKVSGSGTIPSIMPSAHAVTVVARDSNGKEARASFTVRFARAKAKPVVASGSAPSQQVFVDRTAGLTAGQLELAPQGEVRFTPYNRATFVAGNGAPLNWHPLDPESEVICIYGAFRYACELDAAVSSAALPASVTVRIPDIGRGSNVQVVFKGPYGDSTPVPVTINSRVTVTLRQGIPFARPVAGKLIWRGGPATIVADVVKNASTKACGQTWLVWDTIDASAKLFYQLLPGALPFNLGLAGEAKNRLISVPTGQPITTDNDKWAVFESDAPLGLNPSFTQDIVYSYFTRVGECADRRR